MAFINSSGAAVIDSGTIVAVPPTSTTATRTDVTRSNISQMFLAPNLSRKGATIYNDSTTNLFIKLGASASTTDFIVRLQSQDYYEVPFNYVGRVDGVWSTSGLGDARISELT